MMILRKTILSAVLSVCSFAPAFSCRGGSSHTFVYGSVSASCGVVSCSAVPDVPRKSFTGVTADSCMAFQGTEVSDCGIALSRDKGKSLWCDGTADAGLYVRMNFLRWLTLTPDAGIEWRIGNTFGLAVNGRWAAWRWDGMRRRYALWEVSPEIRAYFGREDRCYAGLMYKIGQFNCKFSDMGRQGRIEGVGLIFGYMLRLGRSLDLDFCLGLGGVHARYDKYAVEDGVRRYAGSGVRNWWGPVSAGVSLSWRVF